MSADKYPSIFSRQMKAIVYIWIFLLRAQSPTDIPALLLNQGIAQREEGRCVIEDNSLHRIFPVNNFASEFVITSKKKTISMCQ